MDFLTIDLVIKAVVVVGVCLVVWRVLQPRYDVKIVLVPDGIKQVDGVPQKLRRELDEFLEQNLPAEGKVVIGGRRQQGGRLRLVFRGPVDGGQQQRFRNFFSLLF